MKTTGQILVAARGILADAAQRTPEHANRLGRMNLRVSTRMTRTAGTAAYGKNEITLSLPFFADQSNFEKELFEVVTHEAAHLIVGREGRNRQPHGPQFRMVHRSMGGSGKRCHTMALADGFQGRRRAARTAVPCPRCGQDMPMGPTQLKRHRAILARGGRGYTHSKC